ncbi:MAG: protein TolQ [Sandaracinaceae bacterium]|nr:protein TolQ [Sandaracinaceae bacterium]MDW8246627.1 protein TolQ [Sandaracinaceae bacterium]
MVVEEVVILQGAGMPPRLDPLELILGASLVVKIVMLVLFAMSLLSWFVIGSKAIRFLRIDRESKNFLEAFWNPADEEQWSPARFESLYAQLSRFALSPLARVFQAGYVELAHITASRRGVSSDDILNVERVVRHVLQRELTLLESQLPILATTGSVAPFIGLFGTVWGIMNSFLSIGAQKGAGLDVVAPGIAEALIATALGLLAAIPAVMAYNYFLRRLQVLSNEAEGFATDYLNLVKRSFF